MRADRAVRTEMLQLRRFPRQRDDRGARLRRGARKADVRTVDPELVHELEEPLLDFARWGAHPRSLQTVAKRLVVQLDRAVVSARRAPIAIPVVDQPVELGLHIAYGA